MVVLELKNLTKKFGKVVAVDNLNLKVSHKEFMALLGPSGCGKSTTLRLVAGLEFPTEGRVYMDGKDITYVHPKDRKMSMVFQSYALYPHMTVFDNIAYPLKVMKLPKDEIRKKVRETAELLGISHLLNRKPKELSGGERQRVALGRSIIKEPDVFLMDEPLANVDAKLRTHLRSELKKLQRELKITTIYVTHDQIEAMTMADRIAVMNKGKLMQVGSPKDLYNDPENTFVADFLGSPPMNLVDCGLVERNGSLWLDSGFFEVDVSDLGLAVQSPELVVGIRPEDFSIGKVAGDDVINFTARIYAVEPVGTETILTLTAGNTLLRLFAPAGFRAGINKKVDVSFPKRKIHIFDKKSCERVRAVGKKVN